MDVSSIGSSLRDIGAMDEHLREERFDRVSIQADCGP
jgi:hypothetical protein